jgi:hypothetical protein
MRGGARRTRLYKASQALARLAKIADKLNKMSRAKQSGMGEKDRIRFMQLRKQQRGYGKHRGSGLTLAGSGLRLAGSGLRLAGSGKYPSKSMSSMSGSGRCCRRKKRR